MAPSHEALAAGPGGRGPLRAPPGHLVLADGATPRLRLRAHRPRLPRGLLGRVRGRAGAARDLRLAVAPRGRGGPRMTQALIVIAYLAIVVYIGVFAFRKKGESSDAEGYFLAGRSLG